MRGIQNSPNRSTMSFRKAFESFLLDQSLGFASLLDEESIRCVFTRHRALFGGVFHTAIVLWAFLSQTLRDGKEASCQSAVARISAFLAQAGRPIPSPNTGDYCKARAKLNATAIQTLSQELAVRMEEQADPQWKWRGRRVFLVDGLTFRMTDTPSNQQAFPQHTTQKAGIGDPIARVVALICLATGAVLDAVIGPHQGKQTGELALFRQLINQLQEGDVVVADRHYCSYWMIWLMMKKGVDICFRKHQARKTDFSKGERLGDQDQIVTWSRPARPQWMSQQEYDQLPKQLRLREIGYVLTRPGRKQKPFVLVTTMIGEEKSGRVPKEEIASLYGYRWNVELDIRNIKSTLNLGVLRCKTPKMVRREFWVTMLAYNLIRSTIALAAISHDCHPRQVSFTAACQYVLTAWSQCNVVREERLVYCERLLRAIAGCLVGDRPGRYEPRVVKRRRDRYPLMTEPRQILRMRLANNDNSFE